MKLKTSFIHPILSGLLIILPVAAFGGGAQNGNAVSFDAIDCPGYDGEDVNEDLS